MAAVRPILIVSENAVLLLCIVSYVYLHELQWYISIGQIGGEKNPTFILEFL